MHWEDWLTNCPRITFRISLVPDVIRSPYIKNVGLFVLQFAGRVSVAVAPGISRNDTLLTHEAFKRTDFSTVEAERKWILVANRSGLWSYDNHGWRAAWKMKIKKLKKQEKIRRHCIFNLCIDHEFGLSFPCLFLSASRELHWKSYIFSKTSSLNHEVASLVSNIVTLFKSWWINLR